MKKILKILDWVWIKWGKQFWDTCFIETNEKGEEVSLIFTNKENTGIISRFRDANFKEFRK